MYPRKRAATTNYVPRANPALGVQRALVKPVYRLPVVAPVGYRPLRSQAAYNPANGKELKGVDTALGLNPVIDTTNTNASSFVLNLIQQGTGSWNRIGRHVTLKSLRLKLSLTGRTIPVNGDNTGVTMRYVVVWDKQPNSGTIPTFDTIFGRTAQDGTESCQYLDPLRYDNTSRFRVLLDKVVDFNPANVPATNSDTVDTLKTCDEFIRLKDLQTTFSATSSPSTIADLTTGALYIFFRGNQNTASGFTWVNTQSVARLRYTD